MWLFLWGLCRECFVTQSLRNLWVLRSQVVCLYKTTIMGQGVDMLTIFFSSSVPTQIVYISLQIWKYPLILRRIKGTSNKFSPDWESQICCHKMMNEWCSTRPTYHSFPFWTWSKCADFYLIKNRCPLAHKGSIFPRATNFPNLLGQYLYCNPVPNQDFVIKLH